MPLWYFRKAGKFLEKKIKVSFFPRRASTFMYSWLVKAFFPRYFTLFFVGFRKKNLTIYVQHELRIKVKCEKVVVVVVTWVEWWTRWKPKSAVPALTKIVRNSGSHFFLFFPFLIPSKLFVHYCGQNILISMKRESLNAAFFGRMGYSFF